MSTKRERNKDKKELLHITWSFLLFFNFFPTPLVNSKIRLFIKVLVKASVLKFELFVIDQNIYIK